MTGDPMDPAAKRRFAVVWHVGKEFLALGPVNKPPLLGPAYSAKVDRLREQVRDQREALLAELRPMSEGELLSRFGEDGAPKTEDAREIVRRHSQQTRALATRGGPWLLPALFPRAGMADYEHWSKAAHLALDEAALLSLGLDPRGPHMDGKEDWPIRSDGEERRAVADRKDLFERKFPRALGNRLRFPDILAWINEVGLEVHSGFLDMLHGRERGRDPDRPIKTEGHVQRDEEHRNADEDRRERASLLKLVITMAIDGYGYDPHAKRSPTAKELQGHAHLLGIQISDDTIRKFLKEAGKQLPPDWKPKND